MGACLLQILKNQDGNKKDPHHKSFEFAVKVSRSCCEHRLRYAKRNDDARLYNGTSTEYSL
jgi:hypothetical protein